RWEIGEALKKIAKDVEDKVLTSSEVDQNTMRSYLCTHDIPDPELMIRTSGESRISNFLLWQMAYTELIFLEKFWPEFTKADLFSAVEQFKSRERRFGKTSEQIKE
ncbi:MAG: undecaprenyl diphosphate synthase family protein, partial [Flavobacteriales bacterium]